MPEPHSVILTHLEYLKEKIDEVSADVKAQNGRVRALEIQQAKSSALSVKIASAISVAIAAIAAIAQGIVYAFK